MVLKSLQSTPPFKVWHSYICPQSHTTVLMGRQSINKTHTNTRTGLIQARIPRMRTSPSVPVISGREFLSLKVPTVTHRHTHTQLARCPYPLTSSCRFNECTCEGRVPVCKSCARVVQGCKKSGVCGISVCACCYSRTRTPCRPRYTLLLKGATLPLSPPHTQHAHTTHTHTHTRT